MRFWMIAKNAFPELLLAASLLLGFQVASPLRVLAAETTATREITDAMGTHVRVPVTPKRIVTLAPSLGELVSDFLGDQLSRIVGVSEYTDEPPALSKVTSIGPYVRFNLEAVVALKPDLVFATTDGNAKDQVLRLRELGFPVVIIATGNFKQVEESIRLTGEALGESEKAKVMLERFRAGLENFRKREMKRGVRKRVLLQVGESPLIVAGHASFLNDALAAIGAENVYGNLDQTYPRPTLEDAVRRNPDSIVILALGKDLAPFKAMARNWTRFPAMKAVRDHEVRVLQGDAVVRPTMRLLEGLALLEKAVYGAQ